MTLSYQRVTTLSTRRVTYERGPSSQSRPRSGRMRGRSGGGRHCVRLAAPPAFLAAVVSCVAPAVDSSPPELSRWARTNQWNSSSCAGLPDQHVLGHRVGVLGGVDRLAMALDDAGVDDARARRGARWRRPGRCRSRPTCGWRRARRACRPGRHAERGDALGRGVGHRPHGVDLRVEHLVDGDEVRPDDVPVDVLERQVRGR